MVKRLKRGAVILCLIFCAVMGGCTGNEKKALTRSEMLTDELKGKTREEMVELFGEPKAVLSGVYGEIFNDTEGKSIIVYYDSEGIVELVK